MGRDYRVEVNLEAFNNAQLRKAYTVLKELKLGDGLCRTLSHFYCFIYTFRRDEELKDLAQHIIHMLRVKVPGASMMRDEKGNVVRTVPDIRVGFQDLDIPLEWYSDVEDDSITTLINADEDVDDTAEPPPGWRYDGVFNRDENDDGDGCPYYEELDAYGEPTENYQRACVVLHSYPYCKPPLKCVNCDSLIKREAT